MQVNDTIAWRDNAGQEQTGRLLRFREGKLLVRWFHPSGCRDIVLRQRECRPRVVRADTGKAPAREPARRTF